MKLLKNSEVHLEFNRFGSSGSRSDYRAFAGSRDCCSALFIVVQWKLVNNEDKGVLMLQSTLTDRWQTTIPSEVRKALQLKPRQRLVYELVDGAVLIKPQPETLKDLYGCLASDKPALSKAQERKRAREARAVRYE